MANSQRDRYSKAALVLYGCGVVALLLTIIGGAGVGTGVVIGASLIAGALTSAILAVANREQ